MKSIVRILGVVLLILYGAFLNAEEIKGIHLKDEYLRIPFSSISEGKTYKHLNPTKGTIEFWVNPDWSWYGKKDKDIPFFFWGERNNCNCIRIQRPGKYNIITFTVAGGNYKWLVSAIEYWRPEAKKVYKLKEKGWHHIAACWDTENGKEERKIFLDGKSVAEVESSNHPERKFSGIVEEEFYIYIGAKKDNAGLLKANVSPMMSIAEFRISDMVRYKGEFVPKKKLSCDKHTLLYIPFEGNLEGIYYREGKTPGKVKIEKRKIEKK